MCCMNLMKVDEYEVSIYNACVSYLSLSEMGNMACCTQTKEVFLY